MMAFDMLLRIFQLALVSLFVLQVIAKKMQFDPEPTRYELTLMASVKTSGNAGFEHFEADGNHYLAAANFWDGQSQDMSGESILYSIEENESSLILEAVQKFKTKGAHGWDYLEAMTDERLLVMPNYYGCGNDPKLSRGSKSCNSTVIYAWPHGLPDVTFRKVASFQTAGPGQTDHFHTHDGRTFLVVCENFVGEISIWELESGRRQPVKFKKLQTLNVPGAGASAMMMAGGYMYLIGTSYHDPKTGWATRSLVFRGRMDDFEGFEPKPIQEIPGFGPHDAEAFTWLHERHSWMPRSFLFLSEDRDQSTSLVNSQILEFNAETELFEVLQKIPTDGAHGAEFFEGPDKVPWLAVANFGDRHGQRYAAESTIWRFNETDHKFELEHRVKTHGATDWEHFKIGESHFLAVSNEGDLGNGLHQTSEIYRINPKITDIVDTHGDEL
eukprot:TRINITY_DN11201_c0_g1_i2.p1 TRINITY_DN11201_c0_g1~~TRINITY_DN11201_c0_g1_i2.p1  ORF type:complete len:442 (-),score=72.58 TRINITY_DN11201_c0_g1_i2:233-1558(-)